MSITTTTETEHQHRFEPTSCSRCQPTEVEVDALEEQLARDAREHMRHLQQRLEVSRGKPQRDLAPDLRRESRGRMGLDEGLGGGHYMDVSKRKIWEH